MPRRRREHLRALADEVARRYPCLSDPAARICAGDVLVNGIARTNPRSLVAVNASVRLREERALRGAAKLRAAFAVFDIDVHDRVALDVGAAAGGFTQALLEAGATRVYAVDVGHGQLRGSLRQDPRVVNLESTNVGQLDQVRIPDEIDVLAIDLSYLSLREAVPQLERVAFASRADAIALIKPQFELRLARPPETRRHLATAVESAVDAFTGSGWCVRRVVQSPLRGTAGSVEFLLHASRTG